MGSHDTNDVTEAGAAAATPSHCPTCRSQDLKTTSKVVTSASYWRCGACGEVWNVGRLRAASRYVDNRRWGR
jgi:transposase-like protein